MGMFCYQCQQTMGNQACSFMGVCGKDPQTAALQDLLFYSTKGVSMYAHEAARLGAHDSKVDVFVVEALFTTVTNVNFDPGRLASMIHESIAMRDRARALYTSAARKSEKEAVELGGPASWMPEEALGALVPQGDLASIRRRIFDRGEELTGLEELLSYGLKGMAAYAKHAQILGYEDQAVYAFIHEALAFLESHPSAVDLLQMNLRCGEVNLRVLELLDSANTGEFGSPRPTSVRMSPIKGKAILVSGHDLKDLEVLLQQTEGLGINVYTHGEMLPAHGYPGLNRYKHLVGNYGGAWQDQWREFEQFPGAILMTTNCIQAPQERYQARIFTCGLVAWPGVHHINDRDFRPVIEAALAAPGFKEDGAPLTTQVGFGHGTVLGVADKVIEAVKSKAIRRFFLIGGCDGASFGRSYYADFAKAVPHDCVVLTLACGKYRFNKLDFGSIGELPRLLDCGQCNDAYSAIKIAGALASAFNCSVNELPLSLVLSWYEQKAVCILLTLLHLGIKNIRLGPTLPAFLTPSAVKVLVDNFKIKGITSVERDLEAALAGA